MSDEWTRFPANHLPVLSDDGAYHVPANAGIAMPSPLEWSLFITQAMAAHSGFAKPGTAFRRFDGKTPAFMHPLECMTAILNEPRLREADRAAGALALLYHDWIEDTTKGAALPVGLPPRVVALVWAMTFEGGLREEREKIWDAEPFVLLLKLHDKTSNLQTMPPDKRPSYAAYTARLVEGVEWHFGRHLTITRVARAVIG